MTKTTRLNDLQLVLLAGAAQRENGSLIPLPQNCAPESERITKAIASLLRRGLVEEKRTIEPGSGWRIDGEHHVGLFITDAGLAAIRARHTSKPCEMIAVDAGSAEIMEPGEASPLPDDKVAPPSAVRASSKIALVVTLLQRSEGATLDEMVDATGWLPHTTRAALTGLRKKGRTIEKSKRDSATRYRIMAGA
jgi:hypothetical protein